MAQWIKVPTAKPDHLGLILGLRWSENQFLQVVL